MEKINVAELLKDCPKGMELDCINYNGVVTFEEIFNCPDYPIKISIKYNNEYFTHTLTKYGQTCKSPYNKCIIFPKGKTTWEGFVPPGRFKDGDVIFVVNNKSDKDFQYESIAIFKEIKRNKDLYVHGLYSYNDDMFSTHPYLCEITNSTIIEFATEEQKEKLFNLIKINGYKWNEKIKTLEDNLVEPEFKDGDILISAYGNPFILKEIRDNKICESYCGIRQNGEFMRERYSWTSNYNLRFATEEEKTKLFQVIKDNGYRWNDETKTLEKLIVSKEDTDDGIVNDEIVMSGIYFDRERYADEVELHLNKYEIEIRDGKTYAIFKNQETKILKPIFKVGDKIKRKGETRLTTIKDIRDNYYIITIPNYFDNAYITDKLLFSNQDEYEIIPNKFDITTLKPFESRVLVRHNRDNKWCGSFFSHIDYDLHSHCYKFVTTSGRSYPMCIPHEGNEHLLGKADDCDEYFKTWE